jgi:hypothetical protein
MTDNSVSLSGRADTVPCDKPTVGVCASCAATIGRTAVGNAAETHSAVSATRPTWRMYV